MHELSLATALAETLNIYQCEHHAKVLAAHVKVGLLSGVDPEALRFAWQPALENLPEANLTGCKLVIETAKLRHRCTACGKEFALKEWTLGCPACGEEALRRMGGNEFTLESIEVE